MIEYIRAYTHIRQDTYSIIYNNRMPMFGKLARASKLKRRATNNNKRNASNPNLTFTDYVVNEYDINNNDINNNKVIIA